MKRILSVVLFVFLLSGCGNKDLDNAMAVRTALQNSKGCEFDTVITADYGDAIYRFGMHCITDELGNLTFTVTDPETISGITGSVNNGESKLIFDEKALIFELLADGQLSPVSAPWILIKTLRSGYFNACSNTEKGIMVIIDDTYEENALQLDIWLNEDSRPVEAEILYDGRRILSMTVSNFTYL